MSRVRHSGGWKGGWCSIIRTRSYFNVIQSGDTWFTTQTVCDVLFRHVVGAETIWNKRVVVRCVVQHQYAFLVRVSLFKCRHQSVSYPVHKKFTVHSVVVVADVVFRCELCAEDHLSTWLRSRRPLINGKSQTFRYERTVSSECMDEYK